MDKNLWQKIYNKHEDIVFRKIADENILVPIRGRLADMQQLFILNPVAEFIWERLGGWHTLAEIKTEVTDNFDIAKDVAAVDILEFIITDLPPINRSNLLLTY